MHLQREGFGPHGDSVGVVSDAEAGKGRLTQEQMLRRRSFSRLSDNIAWLFVELALVELVAYHDVSGNTFNLSARETWLVLGG
jgi:hypothetical protein